MARRGRTGRRGARGRSSKHHPLVVAGAVLGAVGIAALIYEKMKTSSTSSSSTTNVQGAPLPSGGGPSLPVSTGGDPYQGSTSDPAVGGNDPIGTTADSTG